MTSEKKEPQRLDVTEADAAEARKFINVPHEKWRGIWCQRANVEEFIFEDGESPEIYFTRSTDGYRFDIFGWASTFGQIRYSGVAPDIKTAWLLLIKDITDQAAHGNQEAVSYLSSMHALIRTECHT